MVTMLGQKTSKFKYTFLNIFILPALSAAYDALKNAQDEDIYLTFLEKILRMHLHQNSQE
mgnify:CR=1 FL=1